MIFWIIPLFIVLAISIIITIQSLHQTKSAIQIVDDMGIGWNLGNSFDCYDESFSKKTPDEIITLWGNKIPKKKTFENLKKYGIKTIRFPVTWMNFIDEVGNIDNNWLCRVKEVVNWIIKLNMYCILNIHYDGKIGFWLSKGINSKDKFINLWTQIADKFKKFDEHLIFESMNDIEFSSSENFDYLALLTLTQSFVDVVRNSGGKNGDRLLIISGANKDFDATCSLEYKMPIDPSNKLAISIHYYIPNKFVVEPDDNPWTWIDGSGNVVITPPLTQWGTYDDYKDMFNDFQTMKRTYLDKGIPIIITEIGVLTEQKKELESIREYIYFEFSLSSDLSGIMSCLFDNSNKKYGEMNFYDRENDKWYDEKIGENFKKISKGEYTKPIDYFISTNQETVTTPNNEGHMNIKIGTKKVKRIIFNANLREGINLWDAGFGVCTLNIKSQFTYVKVDFQVGQRKYDGSYTFTVDGDSQDYNVYIEIQKFWGQEHITFNYFTLEFMENDTFFDYKEYKNNLLSQYVGINIKIFAYWIILMFVFL